MSRAIDAAMRAHEVRLVGQLGAEMEEVGALLQPHFRRREAHAAAVEYVRALLGRAQRKTLRRFLEGLRQPYVLTVAANTYPSGQRRAEGH
ncbi:hypothetical protein [Myxococcus xanthus]|uniref:hypothetical protein n=1 Tax=Myxococcus xanthus TaxID=34 RepID=UPI001C0FBBED|nr:hypothetical protein [Myxococcus xanthus]